MWPLGRSALPVIGLGCTPKERMKKSRVRSSLAAFLAVLLLLLLLLQQSASSPLILERHLPSFLSFLFPHLSVHPSSLSAVVSLLPSSLSLSLGPSASLIRIQQALNPDDVGATSTRRTKERRCLSLFPIQGEAKNTYYIRKNTDRQAASSPDSVLTFFLLSFPLLCPHKAHVRRSHHMCGTEKHVRIACLLLPPSWYAIGGRCHNGDQIVRSEGQT